MNVLTVLLAMFFRTWRIEIIYGFDQLLRKCVISDTIKTTKRNNYGYEFLFVIEF